MAISDQEQVNVRKIRKRANVKVGKPRKIVQAALRLKMGYGGGGLGGGGHLMGSGGNIYSPELSTDFLELPQSIDEHRNFYRFFYRTEPFVAQAIDLLTELPVSKVTLKKPKAKSQDLADESWRFCDRWAKEVDLTSRLMEMVHEYNLIGEVYVFAEDNSPDPPEEMIWEEVHVVDDRGAVKDKVRRRDTSDLEAWTRKHYKGWTRIQVIPPEQVHLESFPFTDQVIMELVIDTKTRNVVGQAQAGDPQALRIVESMDPMIIKAAATGENVPLNTDPDAGSFCALLARKRSAYESRGHSLIERVLRTLVHRDKLRQAQASIASRHMTPYRIVYGEDLSLDQVDELREQVDLALQDPDFSLIANFPVTWEEKGAGVDSRLLDLNSEYDLTDRQLYAGFGVTEGLISGESAYSGERISLEVINTRFMFLRERLQRFVDEKLLKPMCRRMGFIEEDEYGNEVVIHPTLSFSRLGLRDNQDTFDALFNLYQKGSLPVSTILELLNIDPVITREQLEADTMTINDANFNEALRSLYSRLGDQLVERTNATERVAEDLGLDYTEPAEEGGRF